MERFEWRGRQVAWQSAGSGPPVVFCHGTPFSSRVWAPFAQALADEYSVHLWDMPGYGQSSKDAAHAVDFGVQGELLADLIGAWGVERPHVAFYRQIAQTDERYLQEIESRLGELDIPVRILWGAQDDWIAPDVAHRLRDLIPGSTLRLVEGAGHLVQYDAGVALASELCSWLAAQSQGAGPPS